VYDFEVVMEMYLVVIMQGTSEIFPGTTQRSRYMLLKHGGNILRTLCVYWPGNTTFSQCSRYILWECLENVVCLPTCLYSRGGKFKC